MSLRIATNMPSINGQRRLFNNNLNLSRALERMSSGFRINRASDDAAGLAISENLRAKIRGLKQANRNANDGVSMIQVAEGGLSEIGNMLIRMRELSIQAASDTVGDRERGYTDVEFQQVKNEIQRISEVTEFNGTPLLSGIGGVLDFQIGVHNDPNNDRISFDSAAADSSVASLGMSAEAINSKQGAQLSLAVIDDAINKVNSTRANFGALQNRLVSTISNLSVAHENLSAANSRIKDADIAEEAANLAREQILMQANVAMLKNAHQLPQLALGLLS